MPLPFIIAAVGVATGALGTLAHIGSKVTNEEAQSIANEAQKIYDEAKESLEREVKNAQSAMESLGNRKLDVLGTSMDKFVQNYDRIKHIKLRETEGLRELSKLEIDEQGVLQIKELSGLYGIGTLAGNLGSGIAGAAVGSAIALAASGWLPVVGNTLSLAGTVLAVGEVGSAIGLAGSAIGFGLSVTPLAAIVGPAILGSAFKASVAADENMEKAETMRKEAKAAAAEMEVSETLCKGITEKSRMFEDLLKTLNTAFSSCVDAMAGMLDKKARMYGSNLTAAHMEEDDLNLLMVTRSLAGAVKSVIDVPLLDEDGNLMDNLDVQYKNMRDAVPKLQLAAGGIKTSTDSSVIATASNAVFCGHYYLARKGSSGFRSKSGSEELTRDATNGSFVKKGQRIACYKRRKTPTVVSAPIDGIVYYKEIELPLENGARDVYCCIYVSSSIKYQSQFDEWFKTYEIGHRTSQIMSERLR